MRFQILNVRDEDDLQLLNTETYRQNTIVVFETGVLKLTSDVYIRNAREIYVLGNTAPGGKVLFRGHGRFIIQDSQHVLVKNVAIRLERYPGATSYKYERAHNSPKVLSSVPASRCMNIAFHGCSFAGNTDEIDCGPLNHAGWFATWKDLPAVDGLTFRDCMVGPSFRGYYSGRDRHNFGIATTAVSNCSYVRCVFAGHNRRAFQHQGPGLRADSIITAGYGTMAIGLHAGTTADIRRFRAIPFSTTPADRPSPIRVVTGTKDYTQWDQEIGLYLEDVSEICQVPKHQNPGQGWDLVGEYDEGITVQLIDAMGDIAGVPVEPMTLLDIAGVRDAIDDRVSDKISDSTMPWIYDWSEAGFNLEDCEDEYTQGPVAFRMPEADPSKDLLDYCLSYNG